eukprot:TRINITY_DN21995_c4_g1_i1.p3 TRINITY_DN21995_c4_g1~~TRINITY_DN21995_c4_g1_i1.p3  ORF type:complete len:135 (+),score=1.82 TRINITY_DN21995_c4_g1_i1:806-1210(+)
MSVRAVMPELVIKGQGLSVLDESRTCLCAPPPSPHRPTTPAWGVKGMLVRLSLSGWFISLKCLGTVPLACCTPSEAPANASVSRSKRHVSCRLSRPSSLRVISSTSPPTPTPVALNEHSTPRGHAQGRITRTLA